MNTTRIRPLIVAVALVAGLTACASGKRSDVEMHVSENVAKELKQAGTTAPLKSDNVRCEKTKRLGSNRITTVCHTKEELEAIREETQRKIQHDQRQG